MIIIKLFIVALVYDNMLNSNKKLEIKNNQGYIALISVLIISAIAVAITISLIFLGLGASRSSLAIQQSAQAKVMANACVNQALLEIAENDFIGTDNLISTQGSCSYLVTDLGGTNRDVRAEAIVGAATRRVQVLVDQTSPVNITSWQEVSDF
jgi:hypothetical protein